MEKETSNTKCYLCGTAITEQNQTEEHIILNAIGGRLTSSKLLCKDCNSQFGEKIDAPLAKQLEIFSNFLNIKKQRGKVPNIEMVKENTGEKYLVSPSGKPFLKHPLVKQHEQDGRVEISICANNEKDVKKVLNGLKRKNPNLDIGQCKKAMKKVEEHLDAPLHTEQCFSGEMEKLAILKMAISFYIERSGNIDSVESAINDLKNHETTRVELIAQQDALLFEESADEVLHYIYVNGSKEQKKLYAIIELFSALQFVVRLSDDYNDEDFENLYIFDVLKCKEIQKELNNIPKHSIIFENNYSESFNFSEQERRISRVIQLALQRQFFSEMVKQSIDAAWGQPDGRKLQEEDMNAFINEFRKRYSSFLLSRDYSLQSSPPDLSGMRGKQEEEEKN